MFEAGAARVLAGTEHAAIRLQRDQTLPSEWRIALAELRAAIRYGDVKEKTQHYDAVFGQLNLPVGSSLRDLQAPLARGCRLGSFLMSGLLSVGDSKDRVKRRTWPLRRLARCRQAVVQMTV